LGPDQWPGLLPSSVPLRWFRTGSAAAQIGEKTGETIGETGEKTAETVANPTWPNHTSGIRCAGLWSDQGEWP